MPFRYFGGKQGLARYYPPPAHRRIVEPFAGGAGYSLHYATPDHDVLLIDRDPRVVDLWHELQRMDVDGLRRIPVPVAGQPITHPLHALASDGTLDRITITSRMVDAWPQTILRVSRYLDRIRRWRVMLGTYADAGDDRCTWFIDPPYQPQEAGTRGDVYTYGASGIDYDALATWCTSRRGQVIVCEYIDATWLPFRPLRKAHTTKGAERIEGVWTSTTGNMLATSKAKRARDDADARRRRAQREAR